MRQLLLALLLSCAAASAAAQQAAKATTTPARIPQTAKYADGKRPGSSPATPARYSMDVTAGRLDPAPDCFDREVILVNGAFMPTLELTQGDWVEITVKNNIPNSWPAITLGITIHWHGFSMHGFPFMDGTRYVSQCPIARGSSFTYKFQVNEMPGTYFWHDHAAMYRADGLQGALVVKERPGDAVLYPADAEHSLILTDWWHFPGNSLAMRLGRPFDPNKVANNSGYWCWVGVPKSILVNGRGNYMDCEDVYKRVAGSPLPFRPADKPVVAQAKDLMAPTACIAGQLGATAEPPLCSVKEGASSFGAACSKTRAEFLMTPGKVHRMRLINGAQLVYLTVCFEKHTVTVVALDAAPVTPRSFSECVDINTGQRLDVLIKADQPAGSYWVSVNSQFRKGSPAGFGVMRYAGAADTKGPDPDAIMQPATAAKKLWTTADTMAFTAPQALLNPSGPAAKAYIAPAVPGQPSWQLPKRDVDKRWVIQATQPLLDSNGILRWALNSVAHSDSPPCTSVIQDVHENPKWTRENALSAKSVIGTDPGLYFTPFGGSAKTWAGPGNRLQVIDASSPNADLLNDLKKPGAATHVLTIEGDSPLVEVVFQNNRAGMYGGEYPSKNNSLTMDRNGREQHSFHLHGYHFWLVGMGMGEWTPSKVGGPEYNLANPVLRDTATVLFNGTTEDRAAWVALRFVADNPGVWPLHCHIAWHQIMGQGLNVIVNPPAIAKMKVPAELPTCPTPCFFDFANFAPKTVAQQPYANTNKNEASRPGMLPPDNANLP